MYELKLKDTESAVYITRQMRKYYSSRGSNLSTQIKLNRKNSIVTVPDCSKELLEGIVLGMNAKCNGKIKKK